ncbi:hypothetical protein Pcac1_g5736 [Phytophthora cactorum]|nr:hypothetical protein Pcac1_g5736 [Phytophthora cactorum]
MDYWRFSLPPDAHIVHSPKFDSVIVKVLGDTVIWVTSVDASALESSHYMYVLPVVLDRPLEQAVQPDEFCFIVRGSQFLYETATASWSRVSPGAPVEEAYPQNSVTIVKRISSRLLLPSSQHT